MPKGDLAVSSITLKNGSFIRLNDAREWLWSNLKLSNLGQHWFDNLCKLIVIPIEHQGEFYVFSDDLPMYLRIIQLNHSCDDSIISSFYYDDFHMLDYFFLASKHTGVYVPEILLNKPLPAFIRNIFYFSDCDGTLEANEVEPQQFEIMGLKIITYSLKIKHYLQDALDRKEQIDYIRKAKFINSASYMGNKKRISGFIIEALIPYYSQENTFVDLMCGSGAMSQAFAQIGETYASDAEKFCCLMAKIQGRGFTRKRAQLLLKTINDSYQSNISALTALYSSFLSTESRLYGLDWSNTNELFRLYSDYCLGFENYSSTLPISPSLKTLVDGYKSKHTKFPYCLFTLYFSNIYFGLLQCIQLDSLRYAIDQLDDMDREWTLGILVITTYQISSSHAGHFAQPKGVTEKNIIDVLLERQRSAYHEFSKRLLSIADESEKCLNEVNLIAGPWDHALDYYTSYINKRAIVYLDAPYKRDEYSRYYHVLETLVKYDYPSSEGKGRVRSKKNNERFSTEFFTKNKSAINSIFCNIITRILNSGNICVWSYSNNGDASIAEVIQSVKHITNCNVRIYNAAYTHHSQRRNHSSLSVVEYCIIFIPMQW